MDNHVSQEHRYKAMRKAALSLAILACLLVALLLALPHSSAQPSAPGGNENASSSAAVQPDSDAQTATPAPPPPPHPGSGMTISQTLSDEGQRNTIAFDGLAFLTGNLGADSFFPPGKVADFWGFQYLRDNDPSGMGHNTDFLTRAALNMLHVLTPAQRTALIALAKPSGRILLREYLSEQGYCVATAENGRVALFAARHDKPDLILLDIMMPEMDGYQFIHAFRKEAQTPIILLTARLEETDKVLGLELGADDYVTKPYGMRELLARIRAVLRRSEKQAEPAEVLHAGDVVLDRGSRVVTVDGRPVELTPIEFDLLATLMAAPGRAFSRAALLDAVQGVTFDGLERTVNVHIRNLRTKIEADPANPRIIETVYGVGYRFAAE